MAEGFESFNFGSSEALLGFIQERSEDIERVEIYGPGFTLNYVGQPVYTLPDFTMMLYFMDGQRKIITRDDAEIVLNDGILNRMGIKVGFPRRKG
jgi:hypothetical protein